MIKYHRTSNNFNIKEELEKATVYQRLLFNKGFMITDGIEPNLSAFPFYENWTHIKIKQFHFILHNETRFYYHEYRGQYLFIIGHAYNPFDMKIDENIILSHMSSLESDDFWKYESDLTGIYVMGKVTSDGKLTHWTDCAGMRISYYGIVNGNYYVVSNATLLATITNLEEDKYITRLKNSKLFYLFGNILPGDLSPYKQLKRVVPNHWYCNDGTKSRFFPYNPICNCKTEQEYIETVQDTAKILRDTIKLCVKKWSGKNISISVTGGKDSAETLASAYDSYDSLKYFSYVSKSEEKVDAQAAHKICDHLKLNHRIIEIPNDNSYTPDFSLLNEIIYINGGRIGYINPNEVRKRCILIKDNQIDIEIKSWVNEISRAYWYKKYNKIKFPNKPSGKYLATLYKIFICNRILFHETSNIFKKYISEYMNTEDIKIIGGDWTTLWSWEFGFSAGEGSALFAEHVLSWDIMIPYNNRHLMSIMLKPSLQDRINDRLQRDVTKYNNSSITDLNINIVNVSHTKKRALLEKLYLYINSHLII